MAIRHRPDNEVFKTIYFQYEPSKWEESKHRDPFMWPYINQEDLMKPKTLLLLLNSRGRHNPYIFAVADLEAVHLGKVTNAIIPIFVSRTTMILHGATSPDEYGSILAWDKHPHARDLIRKGKQFLPEEGFTILETQERLLSFLVNCCHQILHDIPKDSMTTEKYPVEPQPQLTKETGTTGYESLAVMMAEAPYRVPAELDLERIEALLSARRSAAEDHLWALREDPGYFSDTIRERADHRLEMLKSVTGRTHPQLLDKTRKAGFWSHVIRLVVHDAYYELDAFAYLQKQAHDLRVLQMKHAADISPSKDLPKDYLHYILKFRSALHSTRRQPLNEVDRLATASPSFRGFFYYEQGEEDGKPTCQVRERKNGKMKKVEEDLLSLLEMFSPDKPDFHVDLQDVLDELDRLLNSDSRAKELLSPLIASIVGDISILSHCCRQLDNYGPWGRGFAAAIYGCIGDLIEESNAEQRPWCPKLHILTDDATITPALKMGDISEGQLAYPVDKRRTKENVEILRRSEASLDAFWGSVDQKIHSKVGKLDGSASMRLLSQPRPLQRTTEWVDPIKPGKGKETAPAEAIYKPMSALHIGPAPSSNKDVDNDAPKVKVKTRGTADTSLSSSSDNASEDNVQSDPQPIFQVDARALKVVRTIFHDPSAAAAQGEVPWQDFLHTLTSVGFAAEKLYGSVWQFRPVSLDADRSIQFHEPHPRGKIPFRVARRHGRRLARAYGWSAGTFVLKEK